MGTITFSIETFICTIVVYVESHKRFTMEVHMSHNTNVGSLLQSLNSSKQLMFCQLYIILIHIITASKVSDWSNWTACSATCGNNGVRHRFRTSMGVCTQIAINETGKCGDRQCPSMYSVIYINSYFLTFTKVGQRLYVYTF